jgi:hypothetical protein
LRALSAGSVGVVIGASADTGSGMAGASTARGAVEGSVAPPKRSARELQPSANDAVDLTGPRANEDQPLGKAPKLSPVAGEAPPTTAMAPQRAGELHEKTKLPAERFGTVSELISGKGARSGMGSAAGPLATSSTLQQSAGPVDPGLPPGS